MKGFILTLVGDILLINGAIISTIGIKLVGTPDSSNIPLQTVLSGSFGQGFRIIYFLQLFQGILRVYRKAFAFQK